ncbi:hypothetical protein [Clostridioides difficile]|uniref:hypothetical protein n=1 Tax=Clostridioides difficile TaxID=1496 RepID=UPI001F31D02D|nr:hypothetical protein [Clostridioides difficile]
MDWRTYIQYDCKGRRKAENGYCYDGDWYDYKHTSELQCLFMFFCFSYIVKEDKQVLKQMKIVKEIVSLGTLSFILTIMTVIRGGLFLKHLILMEQWQM